MALMPVDALGKYIVAVFMLFQLAQAFAFGGEFPTLTAYLMGSAKKEHHSRITCLIVQSAMVGVVMVIPAVMGCEFFLTEQKMHGWGWRIPLVLSVLNIIFFLLFTA